MAIEAPQQFLTFIRELALTLRRGDQPPKSLEEWNARKKELRQKLLASWGGFPETACDLEPRKLGELQRDGYRVEKIVFQTRPGVHMTANAYVPAGEGKRPAVLGVHGHWAAAKQDPVPQARCIGLAKLGFFVLMVDAFGAGERGITKNLGQYHGEMTAATLWPAGLPLSGLQVYENMRAVDYLLTRPEVDGTKLGITGASGGGNQSMYAGAFDERFGCVVPTCSVGTYQSYLGAACCLCEVVPDAMTYTEEAAILAMVAPRALMIINATQDSFQFSVGEAQKSIAAARPVFALHGKEASLKHAVFESKHDYNKAMREAMYGWMTLHLKGEGSGDPIPEPEIKLEDPQTLRCWPGDSRPESFVTLPMFAAAESRKLVEKHNLTKHVHPEHWEATAERLRHGLIKTLVGGLKRQAGKVLATEEKDGRTTWRIETTPGIEVTAELRPAKDERQPTALIVDLDGMAHASESPEVQSLAKAGWNLVLMDLRATGRYAVPGDKIGGANDHNSAEWAVWTGRSLLGHWVFDLRHVVDTLIQAAPERALELAVVGLGAGGLVALAAGAIEQRLRRVIAVGSPSTFVSDVPYTHGRLGVVAPRILRDVGDIPHLAALAAPKRVAIVKPADPSGKPLDPEGATQAFAPTAAIFALLKAPEALTVGVNWEDVLPKT